MEIIWGRFVEKTGGQKSRATVPLMFSLFPASSYVVTVCPKGRQSTPQRPWRNIAKSTAQTVSSDLELVLGSLGSARGCSPCVGGSPTGGGDHGYSGWMGKAV